MKAILIGKKLNKSKFKEDESYITLNIVVPYRNEIRDGSYCLSKNVPNTAPFNTPVIYGVMYDIETDFSGNLLDIKICDKGVNQK